MKTVLAAWLLLVSASVLAQEKIFVLSPAELDPAAEMDEDVRKQCNIEEIVGRQVAEQIKIRNPSAVIIQDRSEAGQGKFVRLIIARNKQISGVEIRRLNVSADIVEKGNIVGSRDFRARTTVPTDERHSVCDLTARMATALGKQVAVWVLNQERKMKASAKEHSKD